MNKKSSVKLYYEMQNALGKTSTRSKTVNFIKNDASQEEITALKEAFSAMMEDNIKRVEKITVEAL